MQLCQMSTHFSEVHHLQQPSVSLSVRPWRLALRGLPLRRGLFVVEVLDSSWRCWTPAAGVRSARWTCLSSWPQRFPPMEHCWRKIDRDSSCAVAIQHRALTPSVSMRSQLASDLLGVRGGGGRCKF